MKKGILLGIVILVIGMSFTGTTYSLSMSKSQKFSFDGNILYVGGSDPGNYSKIQDAIDNASDGDTVFVYDDSSPYYENVTIDKSIQLIGENKYTTVIDAEKKASVIFISNNSVTVSGFTLQYSGTIFKNAGISINSNYNVISGNNIFYCDYNDRGYGIYLYKAEYNSITGNNISYCNYGIRFYKSHNNNIIGNNITNNDGHGICLASYEGVGPSSRNTVSGNFIEDGARIVGGANNVFIRNTFKDRGIYLKLTKNNVISKNNFFNCDASFSYLIEERRNSNNKFTQNYWNKPRDYPKIIWGDIGYIKSWEGYYSLFPWIHFDWFPAQEPYNITTAQGCGIE